MVDATGQNYLPPPRPGAHGEMIMVRTQTWMERHLSVIVTISVLALGGAVTWGRMLTGFDNFDDRLQTIEAIMRTQSFIEGPSTDVEQNRRLLLLENAVTALNNTVADMRAYDARMEERLAGLTQQLSRIEVAITRLNDTVSEFTRMAIP